MMNTCLDCDDPSEWEYPQDSGRKYCTEHFVLASQVDAAIREADDG